MQCATIEFARNVLKLDKAHSTEFDENSPHPVIDLMDAQRDVVDMGGVAAFQFLQVVEGPGEGAHAHGLGAEFHDHVLQNAAVPLDVLESRIKEWVAESKKR